MIQEGIDYLIRTVHQDELNEILRRYHDKDGVAFMQELIGYFDLNLELVNEENIPAEGRYIFASNHPLGGLDGICLSAIIGGRFDGKIRYLVNDLLLLVSAHDESGTVWLYDSEDGADASQLAQGACDEVTTRSSHFPPVYAHANKTGRYRTPNGRSRLSKRPWNTGGTSYRCFSKDVTPIFSTVSPTCGKHWA